MSKALKKIESLKSILNADILKLSSGNNRMDDLKTMIGQIKAAIKSDKQELIKKLEEERNECIEKGFVAKGAVYDEIIQLIKEPI